jgi:DNA-binding transcriptional LysR family regulator
MTDRLSSLRLFSRLARLKSFSLAGRELGLSQPSVSRLMAALEKEVGVSLLTRTTRGVALTEAGSDYLSRIEPILLALEEADHAARGSGELRGVLRVAVSTSYAVREIIPRLPAFLEKHPALRLSLQMSDQRQDLLSENIDVALRFGPLADSNALARRLSTSHLMLVASPAYLKKAGAPKSPADLATHALLGGPANIGQSNWAFKKGSRSVSVRVEAKISTNVNEGAIAAAVAGLGILLTSSRGCRAELSNGTLVHVLPDWEMGSVEINAVFAAGRAAKPSARAFVDYLAKALAE